MVHDGDLAPAVTCSPLWVLTQKKWYCISSQRRENIKENIEASKLQELGFEFLLPPCAPLTDVKAPPQSGDFP